MLLFLRFLRTCPHGSVFHRVRGRRTPEVGTGAHCAMLSTLQRVRRPVTRSYSACRIDFDLPRRRLTHLCREPRVFLAGGCMCAFEAARQGKTAVITVVSNQSGHQVRQASRSSRRDGLNCRIRQASSTSQTRQSRLQPFVRGLQPPSWPRRYHLPMDESTRSRILLSTVLDFQAFFFAVRGHLTLSFST